MKKLLLFIVAFFVFSTAAMAAVDLNTATKADLESVKGIGPAKAQAILDYRKKHGSFKSVDDLTKVRGFGAKSVANMRAELTVGDAPAKNADKKADKEDKKTAKADKKADAPAKK